MLSIPRPTAPSDESRLDIEAAAAAVTYIANRVHSATIHTVAKVLYFAEKDHLGRHGRTISGDQYIAMEYGPVPTAIYDSLKNIAGYGKFGFDRQDLTDRLRGLVSVENKVVAAISEPNLDWLSASDIRSIDRSLALCKGKGFLELTELAHDAAWSAARENGVMTLENIAKTLPNADKVLEYLRGDDDE